MLELRLVKLSVYYYIEDKLTTSGWGTKGYYEGDVVTFMDAFPNEEVLNRIVSTPTGMAESEIVLPVVTLEQGSQRSEAFELGSKPATVRRFIASVIGRDKAETEDLAQNIYEWLDSEMLKIKNYNQGFPPDVFPDTVGYGEVKNVTLVPIRIVGSPDVADRNRLEITFEVVTAFTSNSSSTFPA